jgi:NADH:ubiquinone oxidoreductase subunit 3 (subunit A)
MKELTLQTLIAVFEEMFGRTLFWAMVAVAAIITLAYVYVLVRDRTVSWRKFLLAQLSMPVGAVAAVVFVKYMTNSHIHDIGGPVDVFVVLGVGAAGAGGMAILVYTLESLLGTRRTQPPER